MAGLKVGCIPRAYKDLYEAVCPAGTQRRVPKELWTLCAKSSSLPDSSLEEIWSACAPAGATSCELARDSFYKSLAFIALAQQSKPVNEKVLQAYTDTELPIPKLSSLSELNKTAETFYRESLPTRLGYSYQELKEMDVISVKLKPERKGTVFKHVEYQVESTSLGSSVTRRYKDFEALHEVLLQKFPYRLIPRLPPKKLTASVEFLEQRRRSLRRFLLLLVRHPLLSSDEVVAYFLTSSSTEDFGMHLKDKHKNVKDEYHFNKYAELAEEHVNKGSKINFDEVHSQISLMHRIMSDLLHVAQAIERRTLGTRDDMKLLSKNLDTMGTSSVLDSPWTSGSDEAWTFMKLDFRNLVDKFSSLSDTAQQQAVQETSKFTENVHLFLDLITTYQDLWDRRDQVHRRHQKALGKVHTMVNYKDHLQSQGKHMTQKDSNKYMKRDADLLVIEKRNFFSLLCLELEAQLVHVNLAQLPEMFQRLVETQVDGHSQFLKCWEAVKTVTDQMGRHKLSGAVAAPTSLSLGSSSPSTTSSTPLGSQHVASPFT